MKALFYILPEVIVGLFIVLGGIALLVQAFAK